MELTLEELFNRVWRKPLREVAQDLGISRGGLAKLCRRGAVPVPPLWPTSGAHELSDARSGVLFVR